MNTTELSEDERQSRAGKLGRVCGNFIVFIALPLAVAFGCYTAGYRDGAREAKVAMFGVMERLLKAGNDDGKREYR